MRKIILCAFLFASTLLAEEYKPEVDCLILEDENSIICKYINTRSTEDKNITFEWIDPSGELSRTRDMMVPSGHGSVYDFRYIEGRQKGIWTLKVSDGKDTLETKFEIK